MSAIFISHSSADNTAAGGLKAWLEAQGHTSVFLDVDREAGINAGANWEQTLYRQLRQCQAVIALLTPDWLASKWCFAELVQARERGKAIFVVKVRPCESNGVFSDLQHIDLTQHSDDGYERLRLGLLARGLDPLGIFDWDARRPPYPGLMAFQESDAAIFFGRGEETLALVETLDGMRRQSSAAVRFALVLGASGSGKSSLVRAGVIPRLKKSAQWLTLAPIRPQTDPLDELAMSLGAALDAHGRHSDWAAIRTDLQSAAEKSPSDGDALLAWIWKVAAAARQRDSAVLLTIDQAEELFEPAYARTASRFLRLLRAALESGDQRLIVLATIRADFLDQFQNHPALQDGEYAHHFRYQAIPVDPMPLRSFPAIVRGPAAVAGVRIEDGLVEAMTSDTGSRDALPLLAFMLRRLYERLDEDGQMTVQAYERLGRLEGAVRDEAQGVLAQASPTTDDLDALHAAFVPALVRINAEGGYVRRRARLAELPSRARPLLRRFVDARLLVSGRDADGEETLEVAHEALLRTWPQLGAWLAEDAANLHLLEGLQRAAAEWDGGSRRDDLLVHHTARLHDVESLVAGERFALHRESIERAYLNACRAAQDARDAAERDERERRVRDAEQIAAEQKKAVFAQRRTTRVAVVGLAVALVIASVAIALFVRAGRETRRANANRLAVSSERERDVSVDLGLLLAVEAVAASSEPTEEAKSALLSSLNRFPALRAWLQGHTAVVAGMAYSADGKRLATASADKTVRLWDTQTGRPAGPPLTGHTDRVTSVAFSRDGTLLATGSYDHTVRLWNAQTSQPLPQSFTGHSNSVTGVAFNPDGTLLASSSWDSSVRVWDVSTGQLQRELVGHEGLVNSVAFSPDGSLIASAGSDNTVRLWDVTTGQERSYDWRHECKMSFEGCIGAVYVVAFSPDGKYVASGGYDKAVRWWDVTTGAPAGSPEERHANAVMSLAFIPGGTPLVAVGSDQMVPSESPVLWSSPTDPSSKLLDGQLPPAALVAVSPVGGQMASADGSSVRLWNLDDRQRTLVKRMLGHKGNVTSVVFSPDGSRVASSGEDHAVHLWSADTGDLVGKPFTGHSEWVSSVAFTSDAKRLVSFANDGSIRTWNLDDGEAVATVSTGLKDVSSAAFSRDGRRLAVGGQDGVLSLWNVESSRFIARSIDGHKGGVTSVAFSADGDQVASVGMDNALYIRSAGTGDSIHRVATGHTDGIHAVAFDRDGNRVATGGEDRSIRLWDARTGAATGQPLIGHGNAVVSLAFSDQDHLVSGSRDGTVRLWHVQTGQTVGTMLASTLSAHEVASSPDQKRLAAALSNSVYLLDVDVGSWVRHACAIANRNMTIAEWRKYMGDEPYRKTCADLPEPTAAPASP
jgi:WD40 repeat protein